MRLLDSIRKRLQGGHDRPLRQPGVVAHSASLAVPGTGFAVVDVETTGLAPYQDRVVEIAVISTDPVGRPVDEWSTLVNPCGPVGATKIHGITAADVRRAPRFVDLIGELNARLAGRALVAHNAPFDLAFVQAEYARAGWEMPASPYLCTLDASWTYLPALYRRRLSDCCWASGIHLDNAHSAIGDARAVATLLASYLDPRFGPPPLPDHLQLPADAAPVPWPAIPRTAVDVTLRGPVGPAAIPAQAGMLAALLDDLPLSTAIEQGAPAGTTAYLELLAEVLEDGVLTADEATSLAALAKVYSLTRQEIHAAHRGFLLALAHKVIEDGKVTRDEREELLATASILGFTDDIVRAVLDEARASLAEERSKDCKPLPNSWPYGEPLHIGDGVAFTGCDDLVRARLEGRAQAVGLRVTGGVSRKTKVLVTDGVDIHTTKAESARQFGTRVVTPDVFAHLIVYIQPAPVETEKAAETVTVPSSTHLKPGLVPIQTITITSLPAPGPAIRAWARDQGMPVGVRGRLPADVVAAYAAAHQPEASAN